MVRNVISKLVSRKKGKISVNDEMNVCPLERRCVGFPGNLTPNNNI
jgi:hypothetical protein